MRGKLNTEVCIRLLYRTTQAISLTRDLSKSRDYFNCTNFLVNCYSPAKLHLAA